MNSTLTHASSPGLKRARTSLQAVLIILAVAATFLGLDRLVRGPDFVDRLEIRNPTDEIADVRVTSEEGGSWLDFGVVEPRRTAAFEEVIDQGDTWIFEFRFAGIKRGQLRMSRVDLQRAGWHIAVPTDEEGRPNAPR